MPDPAWIPSFIQGGALLIVAFFVFWGMTKTFPTITERFMGELEKTRRDFLEQLNIERKTHEDGFRRIEGLLEIQNRLLIMLIESSQGTALNDRQKVMAG